MNRKEFIYSVALAAGGAGIHWPVSAFEKDRFGQLGAQLRDEPPAEASVSIDRGGPRLFLNGELTPPFLALSTALYPTIGNFRQAGIKMFNPIIGMRSGWTGPSSYDWSTIDAFLFRLLDLHPDAFFFPRFQLNTPTWWKNAHPEEMASYGVPHSERRYDILAHSDLTLTEGGHYMGSGRELWEATFASQVWLDDTESMLRNYIQHIEESPLRSRIMGYFVTTGRTGEWNYFGANFFPGYSKPMQEACGPIPEVRERLSSTYGLLRDPAKEVEVMRFYQCYHELVARNITRLARAVKDETDGRVLCGTYYGYLTESVRIQDGGYLAPMQVLDCADIDVLACPYAYQSTNIEGDERWKSDMEDGAGNQLGRARGVAGDGAFRAMVSSIRNRGKLYLSEVDPSTYLDVTDSWRGIGGSGSKSIEGTLRIMRRDMGKFWAEGVAGWLYDFGPLHGVQSGWYGDQPIIDEITKFSELMAERTERDISPVAEIAVLCDADSFRATRHWMAEKPWHGFGIRYSDLFNHWFLNAQSRALNRIGAPVEWLHSEDFLSLDKSRHKLVIVPNTFLLERSQIGRIRDFLANSGITVVWYYAPGFLDHSGIQPNHMSDLTGFSFDVHEVPGRMIIDATIDPDDNASDLESSFGIKSDAEYYPRFSPVDDNIDVLGVWADRKTAPAFARREMDGWTSLYVGTAPIPVHWLRRLAEDAGASLWSTSPDIVSATEDSAMLVATSEGGRVFTPHKSLRESNADEAESKHELICELGDVRLFTAG